MGMAHIRRGTFLRIRYFPMLPSTDRKTATKVKEDVCPQSISFSSVRGANDYEIPLTEFGYAHKIPSLP